MWYLLAAVALTTATSADVTATRLDGTTVVGQIAAWHDDQLVLATVEGAEPIPVKDLLSVRISPAADPPRRVPVAGTLQPVVITVDGSVIPVKGFRTSGGDAVATVDTSAAAAPQELPIRLRDVRAVRLQPLDAAVAEQWQEIRGLTLPNDLLVVLKRGGKSLDYLEGVIGEITDDAIEFTLDGARVEVARGKVAGLAFYRPKPELRAPAAAGPPPQSVLVGQDDLRLVAETVRLDGGSLHVVTTEGLELAWPLEQIQAADFSAGKVVFLGDIQPASVTWRPLVSLPVAATRMARFGQPRIDQSATGGTLSLWFPDESVAEGTGSIRTFDRGLAIRSRTELVYRLPRGFSRFVTIAGIEPETRASGSVMLTVYGDDRLLMEAAISGRDAPLAIELDVADVRRLKIIVDYGDNLDTGDWLNLSSARIVK